MKIGSVDLAQRVFVVAEIGNNHEGSFALAEELIGLAAKAGADAVKFQTIVPEKLVASSQKERLEQLRKFQLSYAQYEKLSQTAAREGVVFLSTPFDIESARFLNGFVPAFKIASGDNDFIPLIEFAAGTGKPVLVSTGFLSLDEMADLRRLVPRDLCLLHCVARYPTPPEDARLATIRDIAALGVVPGYSDHTLGIEAAQTAVALGARVLEKHFTKNKQYSSFRDHALSADPADMAALVQGVRRIEKLIGSTRAPRSAPEMDNRTSMRRSVAASVDLKRGHTLTAADLTWLRPGGGLKPGEEKSLVGKKLTRDIKAGETLGAADLERVS